MLPKPVTRGRYGCAAILTVALATAAHLAHAGDPEDPLVLRASSVVARLEQPDVAAKTRTLREMAGRRDPAAIARALREIESDPSLDAVARDGLLDTGLNALAALEPVPDARAAVERLQKRKPSVLVALEDAPGALLVPLIDPGATARWVSARWEIGRVRAAALAALRTGDTALIDSLTGASGDRRSPAVVGLREALAAVEQDTLVGWRDTFHATLGRAPGSGEFALIVARRLNDAALAAAVLTKASHPVAAQAVRWISIAPELGDRLALLEMALGRPAVASEACFALARLAAAGDPAARAHLLALLGDEARGGSAAAALAQIADPTVTRELGERLATRYPDLVRQRAVLALGMSHTADARDALERFAASAGDDDVVRSNARQWLDQR